jgi:hypothetical protein
MGFEYVGCALHSNPSPAAPVLGAIEVRYSSMQKQMQKRLKPGFKINS